MSTSSSLRLTAELLRQKLQLGEQDFRSAALRGLDLHEFALQGCDLSGADLRGTSLADADLRGAKLIRARMGTSLSGTSLRALVTLLAALIAVVFQCVLTVLSAGIAMDSDLPAYLKLPFVALTLCWLIIIFRRGVNLLSGVMAVATGIAVGIVAAGAITGNSGNIIVAAMMGAGIGAMAAAAAVLVVAFGDAVAVGASLGMAAAVWMSGGAISTVFVGGYGLCLPLVALVLRRRSLRGDSRDAWLRTLALWVARLAGTDLSGAKLADADLSGVDLHGIDFRGALFLRTRLRGATGLDMARCEQTELHLLKLQRLATTLDGSEQDYAGLRVAAIALGGARLDGCILRGCNLGEADLTSAELRRTDLRGAQLQDARLGGAQLEQALLEDADLRGANLKGAELRTAKVAGARIDRLTFEQSQWSMDELVALRERGVHIIGLDKFPESARVRLLAVREGLTLYFRTRLDRLDRVLVDTTIVGVLGKDTDCELADFSNSAERAVVRLTSPRREDLERVAEAIYRKAWEEEQSAVDEAEQDADEQSDTHALIRILDLFKSPPLRARLRSLFDRLEALEMRERTAQPKTRTALVPADRARASTSTQDPAPVRWRMQLRPEEEGGAKYEFERPWRLLLLHAPEDDRHAEALRKHLIPLIRERLAAVSEPIIPGVSIAEEFQLRLREADVVVVLVTADAMASEVCVNLLRQAVERTSPRLPIVPVLVRAASVEGTPLEGCKTLPENGREVTDWRNKDRAWKSVTDSLRILLRSRL